MEILNYAKRVFMKKCLSIGIGALLLFGLSGCGPKKFSTGFIKDPAGNSANIAAAPSSAFLTSSQINETVNYTLQVAAQATLKEGQKYFSIVEPILISNIDKENPYTAMDYSLKCANNNIAKAIFIYTNPCTVAKGNLNDILGGSMRIMMYDDTNRPNNMNTYDAAQVVKDMQENGIYNSSALAL